MRYHAVYGRSENIINESISLSLFLFSHLLVLHDPMLFKYLVAFVQLQILSSTKTFPLSTPPNLKVNKILNPPSSSTSFLSPISITNIDQEIFVEMAFKLRFQHPSQSLMSKNQDFTSGSQYILDNTFDKRPESAV
jgi:hypothetical protein